jgi:hypothetical protein
MEILEFLTPVSEMLEKTTCQKFCQGWRHPRRHVGPCRRSHRRHVAWLGGGGTSSCRHSHWRHVLLPPLPLAAASDGRVPALPLAAGAKILVFKNFACTYRARRIRVHAWQASISACRIRRIEIDLVASGR